MRELDIEELETEIGQLELSVDLHRGADGFWEVKTVVTSGGDEIDPWDWSYKETLLADLVLKETRADQDQADAEAAEEDRLEEERLQAEEAEEEELEDEE